MRFTQIAAAYLPSTLSKRAEIRGMLLFDAALQEIFRQQSAGKTQDKLPKDWLRRANGHVLFCISTLASLTRTRCGAFALTTNEKPHD